MPIYQYECKICELVEELILRMKHDPVICPKCGKAMGRLISKSSAHYKGKGFYSTDYSDGDKIKS